LMPDEPEVQGLLALMLITDARRDARFENGELVLLPDQDRSRWNEAQIARGRHGRRRATHPPSDRPRLLAGEKARNRTRSELAPTVSHVSGPPGGR